MDPQPQYPDAAQRIKAIIMDAAGSTFHDGASIYIGLPDNFTPPQSAFPICIIDTVGEKYEVGPTTADNMTETVYVHIMVDTVTGLGAPDSDNNVKRQLKTFVSGRDPTTGYFLPTSIMYALRTHLTLSSSSVPGLVTINNNISVSYSEAHYKDLPETRDAVIEITVQEIQMVPNRN